MQHRGMITRQSLDDEVSQKDVDIIVTKESFIVSLPLLKIENQLIA